VHYPRGGAVRHQPIAGLVTNAHAAGSEEIRLAVVGCGGRGSGADRDAIQGAKAAPVRLVATADIFKERIDGLKRTLGEQFGNRIDVPDERAYVGVEAFRVTDVTLDVESTEIHVHVEHPEGCRWNCPHWSRDLACYERLTGLARDHLHLHRGDAVDLAKLPDADDRAAARMHPLEVHLPASERIRAREDLVRPLAAMPWERLHDLPHHHEKLAVAV
jgi:hypothetical protein